MEARILKLDGTLGKRVYEAFVPYDLYKIQKKLDKTLLGAGKWRGTNRPFFMMIPDGLYTPFFSVEILREIISWMKNIKEEDS